MRGILSAITVLLVAPAALVGSLLDAALNLGITLSDDDNLIQNGPFQFIVSFLATMLLVKAFSTPKEALSLDDEEAK